MVNDVPSSLILVNLMMEALSFYKRRFLHDPHGVNIPEDGIEHSHRQENFKSYIALTGWAL
jgi:hypothetical protein